jgi:hypothetical protein
MAFSVAGITGYIDENSYDLISKSILGTQLASVMNVRVGLSAKKVDIPLMEGDFFIQDGNNCGFTNSGNTTITQITMELANNKVQQTYCPQTLRDTFLSQSLAPGAVQTGLSFEQLIADYFVQKLQQANEDFIINGSGSISGLTHYLTTANGVVSGATASAWTTANAVEKANAMYAALSGQSQLSNDMVLLVSPSQFRVIKTALVQANLYHYRPDIADQRLIIPGIDVEVIPCYGLRGTIANRKYLGPKSTLFLGTDLLSDYEQFRLFYDEGEDTLKSSMRWRIGVQVSEPNNWVAEF